MKKIIKIIMVLIIVSIIFVPVFADNDYYVQITNGSKSDLGLIYKPDDNVSKTLANSIKSLGLDYSDKQVVLTYTYGYYYLTVMKNIISSSYATHIFDWNTIRKPINGIMYVFDSNGNFVTQGYAEHDTSAQWAIVYIDGLIYTGDSSNNNYDAYCRWWTYQELSQDYMCGGSTTAVAGANLFRNYKYVRHTENIELISAFTSTNKVVYDINQGVSNINDSVQETTNTIKDDTVDNTQYDDFFSGFEVNGHGITAIITTPLMLLNHLTQDNCVALNLSLPYVDKNISLPCADSVMKQMIGLESWNFFRTIFTGFISYKVLVDLLSFINNMRNPDNDNIEVIDL